MHIIDQTINLEREEWLAASYALQAEVTSETSQGGPAPLTQIISSR